jgi:glycosyltransferase domain-containing protein
MLEDRGEMMDDFTLVIPTYNRPQQLSALLEYLEAERPGFRVLVLDSSRPEVPARNRERTARSTLDIEYAEFPPETRPFDKFSAGTNKVTTPFCALCADDDLIVVDGVRRCLAVLRENPEASVAQGYSFGFLCDPDGSMLLRDILYFTPTIADPAPLSRLAGLFRQYQAATYGNYRTPVLQRILNELRPLKNILASELLGTALAAVEGHMIRVPCFSHGRSMDASESYETWHPLEWFAKDSSSLFAEYISYRDRLAEAVALRPDNAHAPNDARRILDLIHLEYLVQHAPQAALEFIIKQEISGAPFAAYWPRPEIHQPLYAAAGFKNPPRSLIESLRRKLEYLQFALLAGRSSGSGRGATHKRVYHQHPNFSAPTQVDPPKAGEISRLLDSLDNYRLVHVPTAAVRRSLSVSVLLCNYNHSQYLHESLSAICEQTRPPDEVVIVDDGSTDDSLSIIEEFARRYPFVRVLKNERNCGLLHSIDRALAKARCDFVVWAAADDRLLPNFLERNIECLVQNPTAQMTLSRLATFRDGSDEIVSYTAENHGAASDFGAVSKYWSPAELGERLRDGYLWLSGNTVMVSRLALIQAGGFDPKLRWHADYFTFWVVALRNGVCTIPETLAALRQRADTYSSAGMSNRREQRATLGRLAEKLTAQGWRDVGLAVLRCPSLLSPFGLLMLEVLVSKPRCWPFAVSYGWWSVRQRGRGWLGLRWRRMKDATRPRQ